MRRTDRETTREEAWRIFDQSAYSVLSMSYRNRPYATALSVARIDETLYFHCARDGEKSGLCAKIQMSVCTALPVWRTVQKGLLFIMHPVQLEELRRRWLMKRNGIVRCLPSAGPLYHRAWTWQSRKSAI